MSNIVELRVYKGKEILRKADNTVANENQKVTLNYDVFEFEKNIKNLASQGFFLVELTNLYADDKAVEKFGDETKEQINDKIQTLFKTKTEEKLTPEQKEIKELKESNKLMQGQLAQIVANQNKPETPAQKAKREAQEKAEAEARANETK